MVLCGIAAQSVHLKAAVPELDERFSGEWACEQCEHGESAGIYAADWNDATSVCTPEGYHEHFAGELALLTQRRVHRALTRVPLRSLAWQRIMHGIMRDV